MALANYADLLSSVATWMNRTDLTAIIPDFVTIAEARISRDLRLRKQIITSTLTTVGNERGVTLPADWLEFENVSLATNPARSLTYATVEHIDSVYPQGSGNGIPSLYTVEGDQLQLARTPDGIYTVSIIYYARFATLQSASTNWLMTNHPTIYLYACLSQGFLYIKDSQRAGEYQAMYQKIASDLQAQDDDAQHSGSSLRVRRI